MADPFSIISLVVTTIKTINVTKNYIETICRAPRSVAFLSNDLAEIESLLRQLGHISRSEGEKRELELHQILSAPIASCESIANGLHKLVDPWVRTGSGIRVWSRFAYGFKENDVLLIGTKMASCKQNLTLAVTSASLLTSQKNGRGIRRMQKHMGIATSSVASEDIHERRYERIEQWNMETETVLEEESDERASPPPLEVASKSLPARLALRQSFPEVDPVAEEPKPILAPKPLHLQHQQSSPDPIQRPIKGPPSPKDDPKKEMRQLEIQPPPSQALKSGPRPSAPLPGPIEAPPPSQALKFRQRPSARKALDKGMEEQPLGRLPSWSEDRRFLNVLGIIKCTICGVKYDSLADTSHECLVQGHRKDSDAPETLKDAGRKPLLRYKCDDCKDIFAGKNKLHAHYMTTECRRRSLINTPSSYPSSEPASIANGSNPAPVGEGGLAEHNLLPLSDEDKTIVSASASDTWKTSKDDWYPALTPSSQDTPSPKSNEARLTQPKQLHEDQAAPGGESDCVLCRKSMAHTLHGEKKVQYDCGHRSHEYCFDRYSKSFKTRSCPTCNPPLNFRGIRRIGSVLAQATLTSTVPSPQPEDDLKAKIEKPGNQPPPPQPLESPPKQRAGAYTPNIRRFQPLALPPLVLREEMHKTEDETKMEKQQVGSRPRPTLGSGSQAKYGVEYQKDMGSFDRTRSKLKVPRKLQMMERRRQNFLNISKIADSTPELQQPV